VSAKLTDEGLIILTARAQPTAAAATLLFDPSPDPLRGPPSPAGGEGNSRPWARRSLPASSPHQPLLCGSCPRLCARSGP